MKLLSKYYTANIIATITVVLFSSICYYFIVRYILLDQLDYTLQEEEQEIIDYVNEHKQLPAPSTFRDQEITFETSPSTHISRNFKTIYGQDNYSRRKVSIRQLQFPIKVENETVLAVVRKSQEKVDDLIQIIVLITLAIILLLLLTVFLINRYFLQRLWKPFDTTIAQLKHFRLSGNKKLKLESSEIDEFNDLNTAVSVMAEQVSQEYEMLKNFTENASHEIQTPLAIINSKLDLLIQGENLNEQQMEQLQTIYSAIDRLSKTNQSLLLLTKIENNQFSNTENVQVDSMVNAKLLQFAELIAHNNLVMETNVQPLMLKGNKYLLDMLFGNLLRNAIRYNVPHGMLRVTLSGKKLSIENSSTLPELDEQVFHRFYRHQHTKPEGSGLGLSIVKQICNTYGYSIAYSYNNGLHIFTVDFG